MIRRVIAITSIVVDLALCLLIGCGNRLSGRSPTGKIGSSARALISAGNCGYGTLPSNTTYIQPGYTFAYRHWLMKGDALTASDDWLSVEWTPPDGIPVSWNCLRAFLRQPDGSLQYLWTSGVTPGVTQQYAAVFKLGIASISSGAHDIMLVADDQDLTFWDLQVNVTAPLYAVISTDWDEPPDGYSSIDTILSTMDQLRRVNGINDASGAERPGFAYSHFVGPYIWGYPVMISDGSQRAVRPQANTATDKIERWLKLRPQDEVGVHIHPWTSAFLSEVPLPACCATSTCSTGTQCLPACCQTDPSTCPSGTVCSVPSCCATASCDADTACPFPPYVTPRLDADSQFTGGYDSSGYYTMLRAFSNDELVAMFDYSSQILVSRGFTQPTSFRAGGWSGSAAMLSALAQAHAFALDSTGSVTSASGHPYVVDSSSTWPYPVCQVLPDTSGPTLCTSLSSSSGLSQSTTSTSQPYRVSSNGMLEIPDNGVLADYIDESTMASVLSANGGTAPVDSTRVYQIGFHPHTLSANASRFESALESIDANAYGFDAGPVVYTTISKLNQLGVWPSQ